MIPCERELPSQTQFACALGKAVRQTRGQGLKNQIQGNVETKAKGLWYKYSQEQLSVQKKIYDLEHLKSLNINYKVCQREVFLVITTLLTLKSVFSTTVSG